MSEYFILEGPDESARYREMSTRYREARDVLRSRLRALLEARKGHVVLEMNAGEDHVVLEALLVADEAPEIERRLWNAEERLRTINCALAEGSGPAEALEQACFQRYNTGPRVLKATAMIATYQRMIEGEGKQDWLTPAAQEELYGFFSPDSTRGLHKLREEGLVRIQAPAEPVDALRAVARLYGRKPDALLAQFKRLNQKRVKAGLPRVPLPSQTRLDRQP